MKLMSYIEENNELIPVEVELELWPGLPDIHFLGRADAHLKESARRIKSAIKAQGFEFPVAQQILVNLRPSHLKKSSRGLELAVAAAYLMETGQIPRFVLDEKTFFYAELSLTGEVIAPTDFFWMKKPKKSVVVTGIDTRPHPFDRFVSANLAGLAEAQKISSEVLSVDWRPSSAVTNLKVSQQQADLLGTIALGQHSVLFAGAAGSGKTTSARILHALMPVPDDQEALEILSQNRGQLQSPSWRNLIQPHPQIPMHSLVGGGAEAHGGELARSDLGLLLLDELFEFSPQVIEALRLPLEEKKMRVSRGTRVNEFLVRAQFVATTNLCPCGDFVPGQARQKNCRFNLIKCRSYSSRLSGPLLDRFELLVFLSHQDKKNEKQILVSELAAKLETRRSQVAKNRKEISIVEMRKNADPFWLGQVIDEQVSSERRKNATLRLAHSFSVWMQSKRIEQEHFEWARTYTMSNYEKVRRWDL